MNWLQRLFTQPKADVDAEPTPTTETDNAPPAGDPVLRYPTPGLHVGKLSDIGQERQRNEDSFLVFDSLIHHDGGPEPFGLFIVADGMGGHERGEVASSTAARSAADYILQHVYLPSLGKHSPNSNQPLSETLVDALQTANKTVEEVVPDGGTTLTAAMVMGESAYIAHVGDTRAYLIKDNKLKKVTNDHSWARHLEESGQMSAADAAHVQNVLYMAIGQGGPLEVDFYIQPFPPESALLLCSDGLWGLVPDEAIIDIINTATSPQEACDRLIATANDNGGRDNITAILVEMGGVRRDGSETAA